MDIVDAHHHIWRQADLPWLLGPTQPRIFGPYDGIKRDYLIDEFLGDIKGTGVTNSVYVQANWPPNWFEDEVAWVQGVADRSGWPHAIVGYCDMTQKDARNDLDRLRKYPLMRGIRQQFHWHRNALYRFAQSPDVVRADNVKRNVALLADYGWSFDLQVFSGQAEAACELIDACPDVPFILQHAGMPEDLSTDGIENWRSSLKQLAARKNVFSKLSAFGTFIHRNDAGHIGAIIEETVKIFGAKRCLFGSNFPIEKLWTDYRDLIGAFKSTTKGMNEAARSSIFCGTARRLYRLED